MLSDDPTPDANDDVIHVGQTRAAAPRGPSVPRVLFGLGLIAVIVLQIVILQRIGTSEDRLDATRATVTGLQVEVRGIDDQVGRLGEQIETLAIAASGGVSGSASNPVSVAPGSLPPFTDTRTDIAVLDQYVLGDLAAVEYYSDATTSISPADGTPRVWLVWAHWCPYCQQELPALAEWWPANAARFPNTDFVTITTSIDDAGSNPLVPYLDSSQFPFPVLVDPDLSIAGQFGTSAFPFWVVTDGNGQVVLRVAGAIGIEAIDSIFTQLEAEA